MPQADDILDLVATTQAQRDVPKWTDISTSLQDYPVMRRFLKEESQTLDEGKNLERRIQVDAFGNATMTSLYETVQYNQSEVMTYISIPWRHMRTYFVMEDREVTMNSGAAKIVDLMDEREHGCLTDQAALAETEFWASTGFGLATNHLWGVQAWVVMAGATTTPGLNGLDPSAFPLGVGGISSATYPNYANNNVLYSAVSKTDFVRKARKLFYLSNWVPPVAYPSSSDDSRYGLYTTYDNVEATEELAESQNDQATPRNDVAFMDGMAMIRRTPLTPVPQLDADTTNRPCFGIDWGTFKIVFLRGEYMYRQNPIRLQNQPRTIATNIWNSFQCLAPDRRRNFVLVYSA